MHLQEQPVQLVDSLLIGPYFSAAVSSLCRTWFITALAEVLITLLHRQWSSSPLTWPSGESPNAISPETRSRFYYFDHRADPHHLEFDVSLLMPHEAVTVAQSEYEARASAEREAADYASRVAPRPPQRSEPADPGRDVYQLACQLGALQLQRKRAETEEKSAALTAQLEFEAQRLRLSKIRPELLRIVLPELEALRKGLPPEKAEERVEEVRRISAFFVSLALPILFPSPDSFRLLPPQVLSAVAEKELKQILLSSNPNDLSIRAEPTKIKRYVADLVAEILKRESAKRAIQGVKSVHPTRTTTPAFTPGSESGGKSSSLAIGSVDFAETLAPPRGRPPSQRDANRPNARDSRTGAQPYPRSAPPRSPVRSSLPQPQRPASSVGFISAPRLR